MIDLAGAVFSPCRLYRYRLWREWASNPRRCVFVGINPSTADERTDDPTIRKCIGFATRWGFGAIDMVNLFAWRDTYQRGLLRTSDPVGPGNDAAIAEVFADASRIVWAWGAGKTALVRTRARHRVDGEAWRSLNRSIRCEVGCLGTTDEGHPRHPLMLTYTTAFELERSAS